MITVVEDNHEPFALKYRDTLLVDSANNKIYIYDCNGTWTDISPAASSDIDDNIQSDEFQGGDPIVLSANPDSTEDFSVEINGIVQKPDCYTLSGNTVTLMDSLIAEDTVIVRYRIDS